MSIISSLQIMRISKVKLNIIRNANICFVRAMALSIDSLSTFTLTKYKMEKKIK